MVKDIALVFLGAFLGVLTPVFLHWVKNFQKWLIQREVKRRNKLHKSGKLAKWLLDYYIDHGSATDLYSCAIGGYEQRIPFLTKPSWQFTRKIEPETEWLIKFNDGPALEFQADQSLLEYRRRMGTCL